MKKLFSLLISLLLVTACFNQASSSSSPKVETLATIEETIDYLVTARNYTLTYYDQANSATKYQIFYTQSGYMAPNKTGLVTVDEGVFAFEFYRDSFLATPLLKDENDAIYTSHWHKDLVYSFGDLTTSEFVGATDKTFTITSKANKLAFLRILGIDAANFDLITSLVISIEDRPDSIVFTLEVAGQTIITQVENNYTTTITEIDEYLNNGGGPFVASPQLAKVADLFAGFNYTQVIHSEGIDSEVIGYFYFNPDYFFHSCIDPVYASEAVISCNLGYIGFDNKTKDGQVYNGAYLFQLEPFRFHTPAWFQDTSIPTLYQYPSFMLLFDYMQYWEVDGNANSYVTYHISLIVDFINNFQLADTFNTPGVSPVSLNLTLTDSNLDKDCNVLFELFLTYNDELYVMQIEFTNFNNTYIADVDEFLQDFA